VHLAGVPEGNAFVSEVFSVIARDWHLLLPIGVVGVLSWSIWLIRKVLSARYRSTVNLFRTTTSVVVPSFREDPDVLERCLDSWLAQGPTEVIVVLDVADTEAFGRLTARDDARLTVISFAHQGKRSALGVGIRAARGEVLVLCDSDTVWLPGVLSSVQMPFADPTVGAVSTRQNVYQPDSSGLGLASGYKTAHQNSARAHPMFPSTFRAFCKQRLRWSRNSYRCYLTAAWNGWLWPVPLVSQVTVLQILFTPVTMSAAVYYVVASASSDRGWQALGLSLAWVLIGRAIRSASHLRRRPRDLAILPLVAVVIALVALPIKTYALFTMNKQGWLTRRADLTGGDGQDEASVLTEPAATVTA
jgi:cellulose synthase/poly-beta-1,6-N-acetylglucosamine synthase-like glycosyltransferase